MKRPTGKLKILAQLADNIFHTTKAYRCCRAAHATLARAHAHLDAAGALACVHAGY